MWSDLRYRLRAVFRRDAAERELDEEMRAHAEHQVEWLMRSGLSREEAARRARLESGTLDYNREVTRDAWGIGSFDIAMKDIRYALRGMRRSPGFTAVAMLSLALGIGANTAIFSLIDTVMLRALPVQDPENLVLLSEPGVRGMSVGIDGEERRLYSYEEYLELWKGNQAFENLYAVQSFTSRENVSIGSMGGSLGAAEPEPAQTKMVSGNYFQVLGVQPAIGRFFDAGEAAPGSSPYAVLSYSYWKKRFGLSPDVLGRPVRIRKTTFTVIGVGPQGFFGDAVGESPDIWLPATMQREVMPGTDFLARKPGAVEKTMWLRLGARLKPGVPAAQAKAATNVLFKQILEAEPGPMNEDRRKLIDGTRIEVYGGAKGASMLRGQFSEPLLVLAAAVGLVLLIACANVANLLLARTAAREHEIGIRLALGAGKRRLARQLLTESLLLALGGGAMGVVLSFWASRLLLVMASRGDTPIPIDVSPDFRILAFALGLTLLTGLLFGMVPALRMTRVDVNPVLKDHARGVTGSGAGRRGRRFTLGRSLVSLQVGLSLILLIGAGLLARSLVNLSNVYLGYDPEGLMMFNLDPAAAGYDGPGSMRLMEQVMERVAMLPGVKGATMADNGLFAGSESGDRISVEGYTSADPKNLSARFDQVGPGYFATVGIPVVLGREFTKRDGGNAPRVCLINETMSKFYFGSANPIGKHITDEFPDTRTTFEIVGVVKDARYNSIREETPRRFYIPFFHPLGGEIRRGRLMVRTNANEAAVAASIRREIESIEPALDPDPPRTVAFNVDRTLTHERLIARLCGFFGLLALGLSCLGLYGVMSYSVARRTAELGIRVALGAGRPGVVRLVLGDSLGMVAVGLAVGLPAALAASRLIESRLYGLPAADPPTLIGAAAILVCVALAAAFLPAWRASRIDPIRALRWE